MIRQSRALGSVLSVVTVLCFFVAKADADPLDNWHWRNPLPQGNALMGVGYGNGLFVAVGYQSTIITSPDGVTWTVRNSGKDLTLKGAAYGKGLYVVVGEAGAILTSTDGTTWSEQISGTTLPLNGVAYGNGLFVAVAGGYSSSDYALLSSSDGTSWTTSHSGHFHPLYGITYAHDRFVAVGWGIIATSLDGIEWNLNTATTTNPLMGVTYGNGTFVAVGAPDEVLTSPDGITWTKGSTGIQSNLIAVAFGNGMFVAISPEGIVLSYDGVGWLKEDSSEGLYGVAYGNEIFVIVSWTGSILTSGDGFTWSSKSKGTRDSLNGIAFGNGRFVSIGNGITLTSPDGILWTERAFEGGGEGITYCRGLFVVVYGNRIGTSVNGIDWTITEVGTGNDLRSVAYGDGMFVAVGAFGKVFTSYGTLTWTEREVDTDYDFEAVIYGNGTFVAVGDSIVTSPDGVIWTEADPGTWFTFTGIAFGKDLFVAVDEYGGIHTSSDGVRWTQRVPWSLVRLKRVTYADGIFVAVGDNLHSGPPLSGVVFTSSNGITWSQKRPGTPALNGVAYGNGSFVVTGDSGAILQSDIVGFTPQISVAPAFMEFGTLKVGEATAPLPLLITNFGTADLHISSVELGGTDPADFRKEDDSCSGFSVAPSGSCTVNLVFSPGSKAMKEATVFISSNDPDTSLFEVSLQGRSVFSFAVDPGEGTIGSEITLKGSGFGATPGKVLVGRSKLQMMEWNDTQIRGTLKKPMVQGVYDVIAQPAEGLPIMEKGGFAVTPPEILTLDSYGVSGGLFSLQGNFFGSKKGKVRVGTKSCRVITWEMNPVTARGSIECILPRLLPGEYHVTVSNRAGKATSADRVRIYSY